MEKIEAVTPTSDPQSGGYDTFLNYICTRDPTASEPLLPYLGYYYLPLWWQTSTTNDFWLCPDNTADAMVWAKLITSLNIADNLPVNILTTDNLETNLPTNVQNMQLDTVRSYSAVSTPAFATVYSPSAINDTHVVASVGLTSGVGGSAAVTLQVNSGSGYVTIGTVSISGIAATNDHIISAIVPANSSYKLVSSVAGLGSSTSFISLYQLTL